MDDEEKAKSNNQMFTSHAPPRARRFPLRESTHSPTNPPPTTHAMCEQIIVIGGGLAGLSTAHTVLEHGGRVLLLDKCPFLGGNSTKATSGINGALTRTQARMGIDDSADKFEQDILKGAAGVGHTAPPEHTVPLAKVRALFILFFVVVMLFPKRYF